MTITREKIMARLKVLEADRQDLRNHLNCVDGAIQDCEHWLAILDAPEPQEKQEAPIE